jgi:hypothetical protein
LVYLHHFDILYQEKIWQPCFPNKIFCPFDIRAERHCNESHFLNGFDTVLNYEKREREREREEKRELQKSEKKEKCDTFEIDIVEKGTKEISYLSLS